MYLGVLTATGGNVHASKRELHANLPKMEGKTNMKNEARENPKIFCSYIEPKLLVHDKSKYPTKHKKKFQGLDVLYSPTSLVRHPFIRHP